jgi:hypothetical protein
MTEAEEVGRHLMGAVAHHVRDVPCASREREREREIRWSISHTDVGWETV